MAEYKLSRKALMDVAEIVTYLHRESSATSANKMEGRLFAAFQDLADGRAMGHSRTDLTEKKVLFHHVPPLVIVFRYTKQLIYVARVVHGARDIRRLI